MELIQRYFPNLSKNQLEQFSSLQSIYGEWNKKINVVSRKDIDNIYKHHILHSLVIAKFISFKPGTKVVDMGTGGGFPGIPLAIMSPMVKFTLVDSIGKKISVVEDITTRLELTNVTPQNERIENISGKYDFFVSRAVTKLDIAWGWVANKIDNNSKNDLRNGLIYLKGGDISAEVPNNTFVQSYPVSKWLAEPYYANKGLVYITQK